MLNIVKKIILYFIPNSYIKRRHFHNSTYHKDNFLIIAIFNNNFCRKILFKISKLLKNYLISNPINYRLFLYQKAQKVSESFNHTLYEIDYGKETRKVIFSSTKEKINFNYDVLNDQALWIGIVLLEYYFQDYNVQKHDLDIKITIDNNQKKK